MKTHVFIIKLQSEVVIDSLLNLGIALIKSSLWCTIAAMLRSMQTCYGKYRHYFKMFVMHFCNICYFLKLHKTF